MSGHRGGVSNRLGTEELQGVLTWYKDAMTDSWVPLNDGIWSKEHHWLIHYSTIQQCVYTSLGGSGSLGIFSSIVISQDQLHMWVCG